MKKLVKGVLVLGLGMAIGASLCQREIDFNYTNIKRLENDMKLFVENNALYLKEVGLNQLKVYADEKLYVPDNYGRHTLITRQGSGNPGNVIKVITNHETFDKDYVVINFANVLNSNRRYNAARKEVYMAYLRATIRNKFENIPDKEVCRLALYYYKLCIR